MVGDGIREFANWNGIPTWTSNLTVSQYQNSITSLGLPLYSLVAPANNSVTLCLQLRKATVLAESSLFKFKRKIWTWTFKAQTIGFNLLVKGPYISSFHQALSAPAISIDSSQVGVKHFPSLSFHLSRFSFYINIVSTIHLIIVQEQDGQNINKISHKEIT